MIATGGLLRLNRRQDSLRSKNRAENKRKRKAKRKRKNAVVVVKGKLKVCSLSGLVAAVGIVVLLVGIAMAVLGYWPKDSTEYPEIWRTKEQAVNRKSYSDGTPRVAANVTSNNKMSLHKGLNHSDVNGTVPKPPPRSLGFFSELFGSYLYSDRMKVYGPLVMGIGIFLFICANAVLHENRDKKTKIINLRDIYSTVIDVHSLRTKESSPRNGLVNYMQARTTEAKAGSYNTGVPTRGSWPSTLVSGMGEPYGRRPSFSWFRERQSFTDTVYSIYKDQDRSTELMPKQWETRSIVTSSVNAFTLPVIKLNNREMEERDDRERDSEEEAATRRDEEAEQECHGSRMFSSAAMETKAEMSRAAVLASQDSKGTGSAQGSPRGPPQLLLPSPPRRAMGSHLSLNALCDLGGGRTVSSGRHDDRTRRFSCPRLDRSGSKGYIKLADLGGDSFEASDGTAVPGEEATEQTPAQGEGQAMSTLPDNTFTHTHTHSPCQQ